VAENRTEGFKIALMGQRDLRMLRKDLDRHDRQSIKQSMEDISEENE